MLFGSAGLGDLRQEFNITRTNFMEVLRMGEVYARTSAQLRLAPEIVYTVDVRAVRDSDFLDVSIRAPTPELAKVIANTYVGTGVAYFGELEAKPAASGGAFVSERLQAAGDRFEAASAEVQAAEQEQRSTVLAQEKMRSAQDEYRLLLDKQTEARLKEEDSLQAASFAQVVQPAAMGDLVSTRLAQTMVLTVVGSLGLSVAFALLADALRTGVRAYPRAEASEGRVHVQVPDDESAEPISGFEADGARYSQIRRR
jgi:uncharacterized protein involved in exopolysaccharide biosynthesis